MNDESDSIEKGTAPLESPKSPSLSNNETAIVPDGINRVKRNDKPVDDDTLVTDRYNVKLVIRGMTEIVNFGGVRSTYVLGRIDHTTAARPDIDLSHLGAAERGVSRKHARLHLQDDHLYITDLNSSNGSRLNNERLYPYTPVQLRSGDEVVLGRLAIQILFD
ncbi:MAG: hypothetical protein CL610_11645 [Anaerolineaceae bacterium]|nr:hypothetical protein [Anaerolineaceae bacterium]